MLAKSPETKEGNSSYTKQLDQLGFWLSLCEAQLSYAFDEWGDAFYEEG